MLQVGEYGVAVTTVVDFTESWMFELAGTALADGSGYVCSVAPCSGQWKHELGGARV